MTGVPACPGPIAGPNVPVFVVYLFPRPAQVPVRVLCSNSLLCACFYTPYSLSHAMLIALLQAPLYLFSLSSSSSLPSFPPCIAVSLPARARLTSPHLTSPNPTPGRDPTALANFTVTDHLPSSLAADEANVPESESWGPPPPHRDWPCPRRPRRAASATSPTGRRPTRPSTRSPTTTLPSTPSPWPPSPARRRAQPRPLHRWHPRLPGARRGNTGACRCRGGQSLW